MAKFEAFRGVFYADTTGSGNDGAIDLTDVIIPGDPQNPWNARYLLEPGTWDKWFGAALQQDNEPALYMYRAGRKTEGKAWQGSGVFGFSGPTSAPSIEPTVLALDNPEFAHLLIPAGPPIATATSTDGTHYRVWAIRQTGVINTIAEVVAALPQATGLLAITSENAVPPVGLLFAA